jgi:hypothetical protein
MFKHLQVLLALFAMLSNAAAGSVSIGTASARGNLRVDSYQVENNATLFNGSVVESGQASVDLRLGKGTEITMSKDTSGTVYSDHLVLQHGQGELAATGAFHLDANGLHVTPLSSGSRGLISVPDGNTVEVAALTGSFGIVDADGKMLGNVIPGKALHFALQAASTGTASPATTGTIFTGTGPIAEDAQGNFYLYDTTDGSKFYQITCGDPAKLVGKHVTLTGTVVTGATPAGGAIEVVCISNIRYPGGYWSSASGWVVTGVVVAAGTGLAVGVYEATKPAASQ